MCTPRGGPRVRRRTAPAAGTNSSFMADCVGWAFEGPGTGTSRRRGASVVGPKAIEKHPEHLSHRLRPVLAEPVRHDKKAGVVKLRDAERPHASCSIGWAAETFEVSIAKLVDGRDENISGSLVPLPVDADRFQERLDFRLDSLRSEVVARVDEAELVGITPLQALKSFVGVARISDLIPVGIIRAYQINGGKIEVLVRLYIVKRHSFGYCQHE
mgnify:CR=1 FL=1